MCCAISLNVTVTELYVIISAHRNILSTLNSNTQMSPQLNDEIKLERCSVHLKIMSEL